MGISALKSSLITITYYLKTSLTNFFNYFIKLVQLLHLTTPNVVNYFSTTFQPL